MKSIINRLDWIIASTLQLLSFMKHERAQTKNCSKLIDTFNVARPLRSAKCLLWNEIYTHIGTSHIQKHIMIFEKSQTKWWEQKKIVDIYNAMNEQWNNLFLSQFNMNVKCNDDRRCENSKWHYMANRLDEMTKQIRFTRNEMSCPKWQISQHFC